MPPPFMKLTRAEFANVLQQFPFTRQISSVHMHHTWVPDRAQYKGHDSIVAMWRFHTLTNGWRDIAQHITIAPDGAIWLGRNWNWPPASAIGFNGNESSGPFMFEMIGNFDVAHDPFDGEQRATVLEVVARVQKRFGLMPETLVFHNSMSTKTCPGTSIRYPEVLKAVRALHTSLEEARELKPAIDDGPFDADALEGNAIVERAIAALRPDGKRGSESDGEIDHERAAARDTSAPLGAADDELTPEILDGLRPYIVNLTMGRLSSDGEWKTSQGDVDAIFEEHLPKALTKAAGKKLRIVLFAHGGLVKESLGLRIAQKHKQWWLDNGVYPIYFIWETGAFETIGQLLRRAAEGVARTGARDIFDVTTDPVIEEVARALQGPRIWGGMQLSAELASATGDAAHEGGARYVARKLAAFCRANPDKVELHAAGHSAGSIFHSYFIPAALDEGAPPFKTLHFLAPAVRVDLFKQRLASRIGNGVDRLAIFTMSKDFEQDDNCASIYRKSLLYLIYHALEAERKTPILGLEISLRADAALKQLFGLGVANAPGEVIWSVSDIDKGRNASTSTSHGGFDDDAPTMNSVVRRVLDKADADPIVEYVTGQTGMRSIDLWADQVDWPESLRTRVPFGAPIRPLPLQRPQVLTPTPPSPRPDGSVGRRRAVCVGINRYPTAPLNGCVADARAWAQAFRQLGFDEPVVLVDETATRAAIIDALRSLVTTSAAGDVIAFQYSGHGTQVDDLNGDEADGDTPGKDEAVCPVDFASGAFLIDDDIGEICNQLPDGVNFTCFFDCCHSGTISRLAVGSTPGSAPVLRDARARFIEATDEMESAHRRFRERAGIQRAASSGGPSLMKEVVFSACLSSEVAWESAGHGEFTVRALQVLQGGISELSNDQFESQVTAQFGTTPRQHTRLYCAPPAKDAAFLQAIAGRADGRGDASAGANRAPMSAADARNFVDTLRSLVRQL